MEYEKYIPETAPSGLISWVAETFHVEGIITFKAIGREDAQGWMHSDQLCGDFRTGKGRVALCWCSCCESYFLAGFKSGKERKGIEIEKGWEWEKEGEILDAQTACCPLCDSVAKLTHTSALQVDKTEEFEVVVPTVTEKKLVLTHYLCTRWIGKNACGWGLAQLKCYIVEEKKIVRLTRWQRCGWGWQRLEDWKVGKYRDDLLNCICYEENLPCLDGTSLENAKLWNYMRSVEQGECYLLGYIKAYQKHKNIENLVVAGLAYLLSEDMRATACENGWYWNYMRRSMPIPKFSWVNWKKTKPHEMLGLSKEEMRALRAQVAPLELLQAWQRMKQNGKAERYDLKELIAAHRQFDIGVLEGIVNANMPLVKVTRYLKRQGCSFRTYTDYLCALKDLGAYEEDAEVLFPRDLRAAHDRATGMASFKGNDDLVKAFAQMSAACAGLEWERDGICVRLPKAPEDLIEEGIVLHHCVKGGGYAKGHAEGRIILFVRHARRPERPWYTLNVDLKTKTKLQLHGYHNESINGKRRTVYKPVLEFVEAWQKEVLADFILPTARAPKRRKKTEKKTTEQAA